MSQVNFNPTPSLNGTSETQQTSFVKPTAATGAAVQPADVCGVVGTGATTGSAKPELEPPAMSSAASMMVALMALNSKISAQQTNFSQKASESARTDIIRNGEKRAAEMKQYFDKMSQVKENSTQRCGLFGAIIHSIKKACSGDLQGAGKIWTENIGNIAKDVASLAMATVMTVVAVAALAASPFSVGATVALSAVCFAAAGALVAGTVISDPGIQSLITEALPDEPQWLKMGVSIGMSVVSIGLSIASTIALTVITGVATGGVAAIPTLINGAAAIASAVVNIGVAVNEGVKAKQGYDQNVIRAEATEISAQIDETEVQAEKIRQTLTNEQKVFKAIYEAYANFVKSVGSLVEAGAQNARLAASV
jgi:hypothetical protein